MRDWLDRRILKRGARARALALLKENLSPTQRHQYERRGYFEVIGGETGKRYRINHGLQMNVEELDNIGRRVRLLCFMPGGRLSAGDVMLTQKIGLELFESETLRVANIVAPWCERGSSAYDAVFAPKAQKNRRPPLVR